MSHFAQRCYERLGLTEARATRWEQRILRLPQGEYDAVVNGIKVSVRITTKPTVVVRDKDYTPSNNLPYCGKLDVLP